jgi:hypothetical protein
MILSLHRDSNYDPSLIQPVASLYTDYGILPQSECFILIYKSREYILCMFWS